MSLGLAWVVWLWPGSGSGGGGCMVRGNFQKVPLGDRVLLEPESDWQVGLASLAWLGLWLVGRG